MPPGRWVAIDVGYFTHPKIRWVGTAGRNVHLASICYSGRYLTDGHLDPAAVREILRESGARRPTVNRLVEAGLWLPSGDGHYDLNGFVEWNVTREEWETRTAMNAERQRRLRARRNGHHGIDAP